MWRSPQTSGKRAVSQETALLLLSFAINIDETSAVAMLCPR